jgi:hypothetical protein
MIKTMSCIVQGVGIPVEIREKEVHRKSIKINPPTHSKD